MDNHVSLDFLLVSLGGFCAIDNTYYFSWINEAGRWNRIYITLWGEMLFASLGLSLKA